MLVKDQILANDRIKIDNIALTINRKELEYAQYIQYHKYNVSYMWIKYRDAISSALELTDTDEERVEMRVIFHDNSKFGVEEFNGYRMAFYPILEEFTALELNNQKNVDKILQSAWEHHYKHNDHHPEYYVDDNGVASEIPKVAVAEMILDWLAMAFQNSTKIYIWWEIVKNTKFILHQNSRALIEKTIKAIKEFDIYIGEY